MKYAAMLCLLCLFLTACVPPDNIRNISPTPDNVTFIGRINEGEVYIVEAPNGEFCVIAAVYERLGRAISVSVDCTENGSWLIGQDRIP